MTLSTLIDLLLDFFEFITDALGSIAGFFTSNLLGQIILGVALFGVVWAYLMDFINKIHR